MRMLVCSVLLLVIAAPVTGAERPNVLLIVADDQGWNDIGYHNPRIRTPHLDRLACTGVELDCHYVQPQCTPTRVALMTGRYPSRFGLHCCAASNEQAFPVGTLTMTRMFKACGYITGMSGKWHMGSKVEWGPNHHGFDSSHGSLAGAVGMYDHRYRLNSPFRDTWHRDHVLVEEEGHVTDLTARETVRWIEAHAESTSPWFFYVPFHAVHTPLVERDSRWMDMNRHIESDDRRLFAAALSHMDAAVGQMIDALQRTGQRERTLVIFTSDNGAQVDHAGNAYPPPDPALKNFSSNKPLRGRKVEVYEGGYRVPAFVNWPERLAVHKVESPMHVVDWLPTLAALVGYQPDHEGSGEADAPTWDGRDVWPLLTGERQNPDERVIYIVWGHRRQREALRVGDLKIVRNRGDNWELYNLSDDPYEEHNVVDDHPDELQRLLGLLEKERLRDAS